VTAPDSQRDVVALLRALTGDTPVETHISLVFRSPDQVLKLRKAVRLPFIDQTTIEARRRYALREFALNAPAAPDLYLDVRPVLRDGDGRLALGPAGTDAAGKVVDWVVRMARVPADDFLDVRAARGPLPDGLLDAIGDAVAAYHQALPPVSGVDSVARLRGIAAGNVPSARAAGLSEADIAKWHADTIAAIDARAGRFADRARRGFVRRGHGDLHLGNFCLWHGRPVPFDALEFDETLATTDLAYDLAFLLMDLDRRAGRPAANRVLNRYLARTRDDDLVPCLPPLLSMRAMVRAHVEAARGDRTTGTALLLRAIDYLKPKAVLVVAIAGLPGTGKSTLARALAPELGAAPGAVVLRSDEIRKWRHGVPPETPLCAAAYSAEESAAVFGEIAARAQSIAAGGHAVVADATFIDPAHRRAVEAAARDAGVAFVGVWLTAKLDELEARIAARSGDASDATADVLRRAAQADTGPMTWINVAASEFVSALGAVREAVRNAWSVC